jgi:uncharacterized protein YerC
MTSQTKHFIEAADLIALRLECAHCRATLTLPIADQLDIVTLRSCPNCKAKWAVLDKTAYEGLIQEFSAATKKLQRVARAENAGALGFAFTLEVAEDQAKS